MIKKSRWLIPIAIVAVVGLSGCAASYDERMDYLRQIALRGVDMHDLIVSQEGEVNAERCELAYDAVGDTDHPYDRDLGAYSKEWEEQIKLHFVDSCVSGVPREPDAPGSPSPSGDS